jgi:ATP-dependent helicase/nuclease subunit B
LRENPGVQARFLLGPAGSGKTFRCLAEVRAALASDSAGAPLVFLAPKQATFQLERQLLETGEISGFTRLQILSFDRLAQFIFEKLNVAPPKLLSTEGRLMVLRALLLRHADELKLFRGSARHAGFAQELGTLLTELQQHRFTPAKLRSLVEDRVLRRELRDKLHDLALLSEKYAGWLREHDLQDANNLLDFATAALKSAKAEVRSAKCDGIIPSSSFALHISHLWLDGFAEMTPQELALLAAFVPLCERATLAFCLETESMPEASWLSIWSAIGKTFQQCRAQITNLPGCKVEVEILRRTPGKNRFAENSALAELEAGWSLPAHGAPPAEFGISNLKSQISVTACANPEVEATFAAREVLKFVRAGNRFRDCAVLVRQLDGYHQPLARVFRRYGIPFFLDRRESVAHHPLVELTRNALRTVAFDWQTDDWFAALKSGFSPVAETEIDRLENAALEFGWRGKTWREPLPDEACESLREIIFPPFEEFHATLAGINFKPNGAQLAEVLRKLWLDLKVAPALERWTRDEDNPSLVTSHSSPHQTVWEQMNAWLDNLALAFSHEPLPLRDWLTILEAGLTNLTVGVVPPSLDEVLIGAIDRARNPALKLALVLGVNESVFPAATAAPVILTNADRDELEKQNAALGANQFDQISRERYLGYIACTRANEKLALTFSRQTADGKTLNPSPFIAPLQRIFPQLAIEEFPAELDWREAQHTNELIAPLVEMNQFVGDEVTSLKSKESQRLLASSPTSIDWKSLLELPALKSLAEKLAALREPDEKENLSEALSENLYGPVLKSSVSRLEEFAQCPFKFFVRSGLHANERKVFELDARERGNFQHDVLKIFHEQLAAESKRWRDLEPVEARERIGTIAAAQTEHFRDGLFRDSADTLFAARSLAAALQDFVEVIIGWMRGQYEFDPAAAELGFGGQDDRAPAWEMDLGGGHKLALQGRIDRVDLWRDKTSDTALAVVTDYKSGGKKLDSLLVQNGIQLQLLAYLGALRHWNDPRELFGVGKIVPAGAFYVNLRGDFKGGGSRVEVLGDTEAKKLAFRHNGRFDAGELRKFDRRTEASKGDQFNFRLKQDGTLPANSAEALPHENFEALLDVVETKLRELGEQIFSGAAAVDPYRKGTQTACDYCDYRAACRIDPWTHQWRALRAASASGG